MARASNDPQWILAHRWRFYRKPNGGPEAEQNQDDIRLLFQVGRMGYEYVFSLVASFVPPLFLILIPATPFPFRLRHLLSLEIER